MLYDHAASVIAEPFATLMEAEQNVRDARVNKHDPLVVRQAAQQRRNAALQAAQPTRNIVVSGCPGVAIRHADATSQLGREGLDNLRQAWQAQASTPTLPADATDWFGQTFAPDAHLDLDILPIGSFAIAFTFILDRPYLSRDDVSLYPIDNPVRKEKLFGLPMVAPSTWKGVLRSAMRQHHGWPEDDASLAALFGTAAGRQGRLHCFPTFFTGLDFEVIAPHDRLRGSGRARISPITLESVPAGSRGTFALLYVPFDQVGAPSHEVLAESEQRLAELALGLRALFTCYGFGAKTSSGFGRAAPALASPGRVTLRTAAGVGPPRSYARFEELVALTALAIPASQP